MNEKTLWLLLTIVGVLGAVVLGLGLKKLLGLMRQKDEKFLHPSLTFLYTTNEAAALADKLDGMGIGTLYDRFGWMMLAMMAEVLIILMVVTHNTIGIAWLAQAMYVLSGAIWAAGSAECLALRKAPALSSAASLVKWGAFALWTLGMFAGLFIRSTAL